MGMKVCDNCHGSGRIQEHITSTLRSYTCIKCSGTGKLYFSDYKAPPKVKPTLQQSKYKSPSQNANSSKNLKGPQDPTGEKGSFGLRSVVAILVAGGMHYYAVVNITDNLIIAGGIALVLGYFAYKWYKLSFIIIVIAAIYFFAYESDI